MKGQQHMKASQKLPTGIRIRGDGFQAYIRVNGELSSKNFPAGTPLTVMKDWRERTRAEQTGHLPIGTPAEGVPFRVDAATYLAGLDPKMPSLVDQTRHVEQWVEAFGDRLRHSITAPDIAAVLNRWAVNGGFDGRPLANASLNRRRTVLMSLYAALDGRGGANVVRSVKTRYEAAKLEFRYLPIDEWEAIFAVMRPHSKTVARLRVILWTGLPHKQLTQLEPDDIDWRNKELRVRPRRKGRGQAAYHTLPLLDPAIEALTAFARLGAWGHFSHSSMHTALRRAVATLNKRRTASPVRTDLRPYDARHSFGTMMARLHKDDRALQKLMLHSTPAMLPRYTGAATDPRAKEMVSAVNAQLSSRPSV